MINEGYNYLYASSRGIKFDVFSHMYGGDIVGSCPTFFTGDLYIKYSFGVILLFFSIISVMILLVSKVTYRLQTNRRLFLYWNIYFCIYLIIMSGFGFSNSMRFILIAVNLFVVYFLCRLSFRGVNNG